MSEVATGVSAGQRVRSNMDGQVGFVYDDPETGRKMVRLDRKHEDRVTPYSEQQWTVDVEPKLSQIQHARVAYDADRALRTVLGEYGIPEWHALKEPARLSWLKGPQKTVTPSRNGQPATEEKPAAIRTRLYLAIRATLKDT